MLHRITHSLFGRLDKFRKSVYQQAVTLWESGTRCALLAVILTGYADAQSVPTFNRDVAPILVRRCLECHNATETKGGLNLTRAATLISGGETGPAIEAEHLSDSLLVARIVAGEMPPAKNGKSQALAATELEALRAWVFAGAARYALKAVSGIKREQFIGPNFVIAKDDASDTDAIGIAG